MSDDSKVRIMLIVKTHNVALTRGAKLAAPQAQASE